MKGRPKFKIRWTYYVFTVFLLLVLINFATVLNLHALRPSLDGQHYHNAVSKKVDTTKHKKAPSTKPPTSQHPVVKATPPHLKLAKIQQGAAPLKETVCKPHSNIYLLETDENGSMELHQIFAKMALNTGARIAVYDHSGANNEKRHHLIKDIVPKFNPTTDKKYDMVLEHSYYQAKDINKLIHHPIKNIILLQEPINRVRDSLIAKSKNSFKEKNKNDPLFSLDLKDKNLTDSLNIKKISDLLTLKNLGNPIRTDRKLVNYIKDMLPKTFFFGIREYFDESLILLKRELCFGLKDILHFSHKKSMYERTEKTDLMAAEKMKNQVCSIYKSDCEIYKHSNKTFWDKINKFGKDFHDEVEYFKLISKQVQVYCSFTNSRRFYKDLLTLHKNKKPLKIKPSKWGGSFDVNVLDCAMYRLHKASLSNYFYYSQNPAECGKLLKGKDTRCRVKSVYINDCKILCQQSPDKQKMMLEILQMPSVYIRR